MFRFNNDYSRGAYASILQELADINGIGYAGYGEDEWCGRAEGIIKKMIGNEDVPVRSVPARHRRTSGSSWRRYPRSGA